jgi:putative sterol carrier protein
VQRAIPPDDITPHEFFTSWAPRAVAEDPERRRRLGDTRAVIVFDVHGPNGGTFTMHVAPGGDVRGAAGPSASPDLRVHVDEAAWRQLNSGELSAPLALLKRRLRIEGDFLLALKLHLILGGS